MHTGARAPRSYTCRRAQQRHPLRRARNSPLVAPAVDVRRRTCSLIERLRIVGDPRATVEVRQRRRMDERAVSRVDAWRAGAQPVVVVGRAREPVGPQRIDERRTASLAIDLTSLAQPSGAVVVMPGQTRTFQARHRDAVGGVPTSNFTQGVSVQLS